MTSDDGYDCKLVVGEYSSTGADDHRIQRRMIRPMAETWSGRPVGALPSRFSVSSGEQVWFSKDNLQAVYSGTPESYTWRFDGHQYDYIGNAAGNTTITGNGTNGIPGQVVDLFGWSTESTYYGIHNSENGSIYSGDFKDWGTNPIANGGNEGGKLSTLSSTQYRYLIELTSANSGRRTDRKVDHTFAIVRHGSTAGMLLFPDGFISWSVVPTGVQYDVIVDYSGSVTNLVNVSSVFSNLETLGCMRWPQQ